MAYSPEVNAQRYPTLVDVAQRLDPNGNVAVIAELLTEANEMLEDAVYVEANDRTSHKTTVRADIPKGTWRRLNYGIKPSKSKTAQVTDTMGMLEDYAEVDKALVDLSGNPKEFRMSEDTAFIQGIGQTLATTLIYGDTATNPDRFLGLAARYDTLGTPAGKPAANSYGDHVIDAGGVGANLTSIWVIGWGKNSVHMIYPKGSKAGITSKDLGETTLVDDDGGRFQGFRTHYKVDAGLVVRDWRYVVRIANIDVTQPFDYKLLVRAVNRIPNPKAARIGIYMGRELKSEMEIAAAEKSNNGFTTVEDTFGRPITRFWGYPIRQSDAILYTESALV